VPIIRRYSTFQWPVYKITSPGTGTITQAFVIHVTVKYSGYLTNGTKLMKTFTGVSFPLGTLILGLAKKDPLIKQEGL